tara:strand:+ start:497 stop:1075 length:579 start_codon:yes stop_codon:yes gene_type:complete
MIKRFSFLLLCGYCSFGQGSYIEAGVNNTSYTFLSDFSSDDLELDSSTGIFLRVGLGEIIENLNYGFSYQQFNSFGNLYDNTFEWKTNYIGGFVQYNMPLLDERLFINPAIELLTLLSGKQFSFGEVYKLGDEKEFTGAWVSPRLGVTFMAVESRRLSVGVGYNLSYSLNTTNSTEQSLTFMSHQLSIKLGL